MRSFSRLIPAASALCLASFICCGAVCGAASQSSIPSVKAGAPAKTGTRRHWRHWSRSSHYGSAASLTPGRRRPLRWHTVRDSSGHRHKQWYYADTGENVSGPDLDDRAARRSLDAPLSRTEREELDERRGKAMDHLAQVEQRVERDRQERAQKSKTHFHRLLKDAAAK